MNCIKYPVPPEIIGLFAVESSLLYTPLNTLLLLLLVLLACQVNGKVWANPPVSTWLAKLLITPDDNRKFMPPTNHGHQRGSPSTQPLPGPPPSPCPSAQQLPPFVQLALEPVLPSYLLRQPFGGWSVAHYAA